MNENTRILERVRKMLALANDAGATEGERDNALRMAHATMAKYNLELADLEAASGKQEEPRVQMKDTFYGRPWARVACHAAARLFFCEYLYTSATKGKDTVHSYFGRASNAQAAIELSKFLVRSIQIEARKRAREAGQGNEFLRSFALGAAHRVRERVDEIIRLSTAGQIGSESKALVLASLYDRERTANRSLIAQTYPRLRRGHSGKHTGNSGAYVAGQVYGNGLALQKSIGG